MPLSAEAAAAALGKAGIQVTRPQSQQRHCFRPLRQGARRRQLLGHADEAAALSHHRQEADNALPAPPHEGQAAQYWLS